MKRLEFGQEPDHRAINELVDSANRFENLSTDGGANDREGNGRSIRFPRSIPVIRVRLIEDLWACGAAKAIGLDRSPDGVVSDGLQDTYTIDDTLNAVSSSLLAEFVDGEFVIRAGICAYVSQLKDSLNWEPLEFGMCCGSGSGSGSEPEPEKGCDTHVPPCPGSGMFVLACMNGECATWQQLAEDEQCGHVEPMTSPTDPTSYVVQPCDVNIYLRMNGSYSVILPAATGSGRMIRVKNRGTGSKSVVVSGTDTIDSYGSLPLAQWGKTLLQDSAPGEWSEL